MKKLVPVSLMLCSVAFANAAGHAADTPAKTSDSPLPEILKALGGHWTLIVKFESGSGLPPGTQGVGEESWRATAGGKALLSEEAWKAGPVDLALLGVVWWNYRENKLHALDCNNQGKNICEPKDAAESVAVQWNGTELIIEEPEKGPNGKLVTSRVTFTDIQANSFSEVNSVATTPGKFETMMTIHAVRAAK
jgi:hypothetical protein